MCWVNFTLRDTRPSHPARCVAAFKREKLKDAAGRQVDEAWARQEGECWKSHKERGITSGTNFPASLPAGFFDEDRLSKAINRNLAASGVHRPIVHRFHPRLDQKRPAIINRSFYSAPSLTILPLCPHRLINRILISFVRTRPLTSFALRRALTTRNYEKLWTWISRRCTLFNEFVPASFDFYLHSISRQYHVEIASNSNNKAGVSRKNQTKLNSSARKANSPSFGEICAFGGIRSF